MTEKQLIRKAVLARRNAINAEERSRRSAAVCAKLERYLEELLPQGARIAVYHALGSEVDLAEFAKRAYLHAWECTWPVMVKDAPDQGARMTFWKVPDTCASRPFFDRPAHAIALSDPALADCTLVSPGAFDAVVAPLVAFDRTGMRLGYGGGNYDRFFEELSSNTVVCGVAFAEQEIDAVPTEPHDKPLPRIIIA